MQTLLGINRTYLCSKISSVFLSISKSPHYLKIPISIFTINCRSTMAASPVALILGAGPRIGASVTEKFTSNGYQVAVASRSGTGTKTAEGVLSLKADFTKPDSIPALFDAVKAELRAFPSVVVYNAAALTNPPDKDSVLSVSAENVTLDLNVNTISPYVAAQQAVSGWESLPEETKKTFIYTGNITNVSIVPMPMMLDLGMGKAASAFWIGLANATYASRGFR
jgi:NAD(P)-dependent dehydrogenase (short-subunit alcohol dehydrogenase family)